MALYLPAGSYVETLARALSHQDTETHQERMAYRRSKQRQESDQPLEYKYNQMLLSKSL